MGTQIKYRKMEFVLKLARPALVLVCGISRAIWNLKVHPFLSLGEIQKEPDTDKGLIAGLGGSTKLDRLMQELER